MISIIFGYGIFISFSILLTNHTLSYFGKKIYIVFLTELKMDVTFRHWCYEWSTDIHKGGARNQ